MNCRKCKAEIDNTKFCPHCGAAQDKAKGVKKRGNGQGSVYKRGNSWALQLTEWVNGKRVTRYKGGFKTKSEAIAYLPKLKSENRTDDEITVKQAYDEFMESHRISDLTKRNYDSSFQRFQSIWNAPLSSIDILDWERFFIGWNARKGTKALARTVIGLIYRYALPRYPTLKPINPAEYIKIYDTDEKVAHPSFTTEQLELLRDAIGRVPYAEHVYCHCYTGFRPSAFVSLKPSDYDPVERAITGGIKTEAGKNRIVTVSPKIQQYVNALLEIGGETIFCSYDGAKIPQHRYRMIFYDVLDAIGIENPEQPNGRRLFTPHSCRHTFATLMKRVSADDKDKLSLMGHTSVEMLRDYQDVTYDDLRKITDNI